jgi:lincosamide nucleotidyltransferase A/C/D/E
MKSKLVETPAELVPDVLGTLEEAGVRAWLVGGWGVDALLGEQTRPHKDLDLVFDADRDGERRALDALAARGFSEVGRELVQTHWWSERIALSDAQGRVVDLHPVSGEAFIAAIGVDGVATGTVAGQEVRCLARPVQLKLHEGYEPTDADRADVALLRERIAPSSPAGAEGV